MEWTKLAKVQNNSKRTQTDTEIGIYGEEHFTSCTSYCLRGYGQLITVQTITKHGNHFHHLYFYRKHSAILHTAKDIFIPTVYSQAIIHITEWTGAMWSEQNWPQFKTTAKELKPTSRLRDVCSKHCHGAPGLHNWRCVCSASPVPWPRQDDHPPGSGSRPAWSECHVWSSSGQYAVTGTYLIVISNQGVIADECGLRIVNNKNIFIIILL